MNMSLKKPLAEIKPRKNKSVLIVDPKEAQFMHREITDTKVELSGSV